MSQAVGISIGGLQGGLGFLTPPSGVLLPPSAGLVGAVTAAAVVTTGLVIGATGAFIEAQKAEADLKKARELAEKNYVRVNSTGSYQTQPEIDPNANSVWYIQINGNSSIGYGYSGFSGTYQQALQEKRRYFPQEPPYPIYRISEGWFPPNATELSGKEPKVNGASISSAKSSIGSRDSLEQGKKLKNPILTPDLSSGIGWGSAKKPITEGIGGALGLGLPTATPPQTKPNLSPNPSPIKNPSPNPNPKPPEPTPKPPEPKKEEDKKVGFNPIPNVDNNTALILGAIASATTTTTGLLNQINSQTSPEAQRQNSKNGACDALNSPSCTKGVEDRIKDPILQNVGAVASIVDATSNKLDGVKDFLEKVARSAKLDKVYNLLTFITVIHNAQMLSSSLATTLMDSLSLGLATFGVKDENESPIDIQQIINKSVEDAVKSVIGTANYNTISERWKGAVRVYQAGANILYQVRSLWDSAKSLNELTGANVGRIGNALRRDGVVSENAYPAMPDSPLMVNSAMNRLQNLEEAASHLSSITSEAYGITETVAQIKKDQEDFKKLVKESPITNGTANDAQKAKDDAAKIASISPSISTTDLVKPD